MPKLTNEDGTPHITTIDYCWVAIPNKIYYTEYMVNKDVADYIEKLEKEIEQLKENI